MPATVAKKPKLTAQMLEEFHAAQEKRKEAEREGRNHKKTEDAIGRDIRAALEADGKATAVRGEFRATIVDGKPSVSWKNQFIEAVSAEAALEIEQSAPVGKSLKVTKEPKKAAAAKKAA